MCEYKFLCTYLLRFMLVSKYLFVQIEILVAAYTVGVCDEDLRVHIQICKCKMQMLVTTQNSNGHP